MSSGRHGNANQPVQSAAAAEYSTALTGSNEGQTMASCQQLAELREAQHARFLQQQQLLPEQNLEEQQMLQRQFEQQRLQQMTNWREDSHVQQAIVQAASSAEVHSALEMLTSPKDRIRGCQVNPNRAHLQALQNLLGWTIGGYDTRPSEATKTLKDHDRLEVLIRYQQPEDPGDPPQVSMYEYLCDTLFKVPMVAVSPDVVMPVYINPDGHEVPAAWIRPDWDSFRTMSERPAPVFCANRYPYQLPQVNTHPDAHEYQRQAQHWILWYFHFPHEQLADFDDREIDQDVRYHVQMEVASKGFSQADYIWYRNPGMSVPDMFHVQVFFVVLER